MRRHYGARAVYSALSVLFLAAAPLACGAETESEPVNEAQSALCSDPTIAANKPLAGGVTQYQGFPQIAVHPGDPQRLVVSAASSQFSGCSFGTSHSPPGALAATTALYGSSDGGGTWNAKCAPWPASVIGGPIGVNRWWTEDGSVAWDTSGNAYAAYVLVAANVDSSDPADEHLISAGSAVVIAKSTDTGQTWSSASVARNWTSFGNVWFTDPRIVIDNNTSGTYAHPGRKYVTMTLNNPLNPDVGHTVYVGYTDDLVNYTWRSFAPPDPSTTSNDGPSIAVAKDGTVYLAWTSLDTTFGCTGSDTTLISKSIDGGSTWNSPVTVDTHLYHTRPGLACGFAMDPPAQPIRRANSYGFIDVDRNPQSAYYGTVYMVTSDYRGPIVVAQDKEELDVFLRRSTDGGATWSARVRVNDDDPTDDPNVRATQFMPALSVDPSDGAVHVTWLDSRDNTIIGNYPDCAELSDTIIYKFSFNMRVRLYYARSSDGGVSFGVNRNITDSGANFSEPLEYLSRWTNHGNGTCGPEERNGYLKEFGDYFGVVAANRQVHPVWVDTRNYTGGAAGDDFEDIATTTITTCSAPVFSVTPTYTTSGTSLTLNWTAPTSWGTGACGGTYSVQRSDTVLSKVWETLASGLTTTSYTYTPHGTYKYRIVAKNNCSGTALTPMTTNSGTVTVTMP